VANALVCTRYHRVARGRTLASALHRVQPVQRLGILVGAALTYLAAGCYNPQLRDCTVHCSKPTDCTGGQECKGGWCAMPEVKECPKEGAGEDRDAMIDAAVSTMPDALSLCEQGCPNGTCVDGVCVIDCSAPGACPNDVVCPANLPCRVVCGQGSCGHKVNCSLSTSCEVQCNGDNSCADEIICGVNRCDVDCIGASSCKRRTKCSMACACDVSCIGTGSCVEASECPASTCKLGNGCTSLLAGCNDC
jgi:hypothetical protein